jgi:hypothetical protein
MGRTCDKDADCVEGTLCTKGWAGFETCTRACTDDDGCGGGDTICFGGYCDFRCHPPAGQGYACVDGRPVPCGEEAAKLAACATCGCPAGLKCDGTSCFPYQVVLDNAAQAHWMWVVNGYLYFTTAKPKPYSSEYDWTLNRVPTAGGAVEAVVTGSKAMRIMTTDSSAYYFYRYDEVDGSFNAWWGHVERMAFGSKDITRFVEAGNANDDPMLVEDTEQEMWVARCAGTSPVRCRLSRGPKPAGVPANDLGQEYLGWIEGGFTANGVMRFVVIPSSGTPKAYKVASSGGTAVEIATLADKCFSYAPEPSRTGWIALCGVPTQYDLVRVSETGALDTVAAGLTSANNRIQRVIAGKFYWSDRAYVFSGRMTTSCWSHGCEVWVPTLSG